MQQEPGVWVEGPDGELIPDYESTFPEISEGQVVPKLMKLNLSPRVIASELFLRTFNRAPTDTELVKLEPYWGVTEEQPKVYHDIFWSLLNAKEFMFNH